MYDEYDYSYDEEYMLDDYDYNDYASSIENLPDTLIRSLFSDELLKALLYICLRVDIEDNNDRAEMIRYLLPKDKFEELGTGTNRIGFLHNGLVIKIALDRRGLVDSFTELKRSMDLPYYLTRTYESNMLVSVQEYGTILDKAQFLANEEAVKFILGDMSNGFLFIDMGFILKNCYNWCYVDRPDGKELRICDYGYLYRLTMQDRDELYRCPLCNSRMQWNGNYTEFKCENLSCRFEMSPLDMRHRMKSDYEDLEDATISMLNTTKSIDLRDIEKTIAELKAKEN